MTDAVSVNMNELRDYIDILTVEELPQYLEKEEGIPAEFCKAFADNYIDGHEFLLLSYEDLLKFLPIGIAKKLFRHISKISSNIEDDREFLTAPTCTSTSSWSSPLQPCLLPPTLADVWPSCGGVPGPVPSPILSSSPSTSVCTEDENLSSVSKSSSSFEIPTKWNPETEACIKKKKLNINARNDICRTLVTLLTVKHGTFDRLIVRDASKKLILMYPFMADDLGDGYKSWENKIIECTRNRVKNRKRKLSEQDETTPKRCRVVTKKDELLKRYPIKISSIPDDPESIDLHKKAITEELSKSKPRDSVLRPLLKSTYTERRRYIQNEASSVKDILQKYPAMNRPAIIEDEMSVIIGKDDVRTLFETSWIEYVPAILEYGSNSSKKPVRDILKMLKKQDDLSKQICALKILTEVLVPKSKDALKYIYEEYNMSVTPEEACKKAVNNPWIASFVNEETIQNFIIVEQTVLCQLPSFQFTLFVMFAAYYIFHLQYPKASMNVLLFFQDYVLSFPDNGPRPAHYLAASSDIKKYKTQ